MLAEQMLELGKAARILVLELDARRPERVALGESLHALRLDRGRDHVGLAAEALALVEFRAIAAAADAKRMRPLPVPEAEMQGCEASHREPDDMGPVLAEMIEDRGDIVGGARLRIGARLLGHV